MTTRVRTVLTSSLAVIAAVAALVGCLLLGLQLG